MPSLDGGLPQGGDGLGDGEAPLVEGAADDRALDVRRRLARRGLEVGEVADAARGDQLRAAVAAAIRVELARAPGPPSSRRPRSSVQRNRRTPRSPSSATASADVDVAGSRSSPASADLAAAGVDRDHHPLAVRLQHRVEELRVAQRRGADHDPLGAGVEHRGDRVGVAQAAADLDRALDRGGDPPHRLEVARLPRLGAVEVDDVQELGPFAGPARARRRPGRRRRPSRARSRPAAAARRWPPRMSIAG